MQINKSYFVILKWSLMFLSQKINTMKINCSKNKTPIKTIESIINLLPDAENDIGTIGINSYGHISIIKTRT